MPKVFRQASKIIYLASLLALCAGCSFLPFRDASSLMRPPRPRDADARAIQALLAEACGEGDVAFRQPLEGGDAVAYSGPEGERVAAAFFAVESGLPTDGGEVRVALLRRESGDWRLLCETALPGAHVLAAEFADYGGPCLLARWRQGEEKRFALYRFDPEAGGLRALCEGPCELLQWADLDGDGARELFYALPNRAGAYQYRENKFQPLGEELLLDPGATAYGAPGRAQNGGREYLLFDADAPEGRFTEAVYWDGAALRSAFTRGETYRARKIPLRAAGGWAQVPSEYPMPGGAVRLVRWNEVGEGFALRAVAENRLYLNTTQWVALPAGWAVTARPDAEDPLTLRFYEWDGKRRGKELFWLSSNGSETELRLRGDLTPDGARAGTDLSFLAEIHTDKRAAGAGP